MGNTLTGQVVAETYDSLLKVTDNNQITGTKKRLTDGFGTDTPLLVSTTDVQVDGNFLIESAQFNTATIQTGGIGKLIWNDQDGTLDLGLKGGNVTLQVGQEQVIRVVNKTGSNLLEANYQVVRVDGAQGNRLKVALAQANNDANSAETLGLVTETINDNQEGFITTSGLVRKINTTGSLQGETWADGDMLYLSGTTAGKLTNIKPTAPTHTVIMGYVVSAHATQGQIYVKVDNGYELNELHNVLISTPTNGQALVYESATGLWKNQTLATGVTSFNTRTGAITLTSLDVTDALGYTPVTNARTLTINGTSYDLSANRSWTISESQWNTSVSDIYYNTGNVGIGTSTPSQKLDVNGNAVVLGTLQVGDASILGLPSYGLTSTAIIGKSGGGVLDLRNTSGTVVAGDTAGSIQFSVKDDATPGYAVGRIDAITQIDSGTGASGGANLRFLTAGGGIAAFPTERMRITNTGNVGIGTSSPTFKLTTNFSAPSSFTNAAGDFVQMWQASGTNGLGVAMSTGDSVARLVTNNGYQLAITAGGTETARFTSSGNIGIGTTSPVSISGYTTLDVRGSNGSLLYMGTTSTSSLRLIGEGTDAYIDNLTSGGALLFRTNNATERMRITSGGNVGIGTTSPQVTFHSYGGALTVGNEATYSARFSNNSNKGVLIGYDTTNNRGHIGSINPAVAWTDLILNANGGNVGIGTSSPAYPLQVNGLISSNRTSNTDGGLVFGTPANGNYFYGADSGNYIATYTANSERMRITSGGSALIGTTTDNGRLTIYNNSGTTSYPVIATQHAQSTGTQFATHINFLNSSGSQAGFISANGTATFYGTSSDYRLKKDLKDYSGLSLVGNIKTYDYQWESDESRMYGVLAHELAEVLPYAVNGEKDGEMMQGVDYSKIVPVLVKAIQEQQAQIEELKAKIN